jgi:hypothetical protein
MPNKTKGKTFKQANTEVKKIIRKAQKAIKKKPARKREDFSQAAVRIVRKATEN